MKITIYELVGLAKDGKAPRQIKYSNRIYDYNEKQEDYECFIANYYDYLLDNTNTFQQFNDEVEIIEEDKDIEELPMIYSGNDEDEIMRNRYKINELVRKLNKLKAKSSETV